MMKYIRRIIAIIIMIILCLSISFIGATDNTTFQAVIEDDEIVMIRSELTETIDNSNLPVKIIRVRGEQSTVIYQGLLGQYENGMWSGLDFSQTAFVVMFDWNTNDEAIYIIPTGSNNESFDDTNEVTSVNDNSPLPSENIQPSLNIQERFYINDVLISDNFDNQTINANDELTAEYIIINSGTASQSIQLILCLYTSEGRIINVTSVGGSINAGETKTFSKSMDVSSNITSCYAKVLLLSGFNELVPLHSTLEIGKGGEQIATATVSCVQNKEYILNITVENLSANSNDEYVVVYDPTQLELVDLCAMTYDKEVIVGSIEGTGINITFVDTQTGEIRFKNPNIATNDITKVLNAIKFKGLVSNTQTTITIK